MTLRKLEKDIRQIKWTFANKKFFQIYKANEHKAIVFDNTSLIFGKLIEDSSSVRFISILFLLGKVYVRTGFSIDIQ